MRMLLVTVALTWTTLPAGGAVVTYFEDGNDLFNGKIDPDLIPGPNPGINNMGRPGTTNSVAGYQLFLNGLDPNSEIGIEDFESFPGVNPTGTSANDPFMLNLEFDPLPTMTIDATLSGVGQIARITDPTANSAGRFPVSVPVGGVQYFDTNFSTLFFTIDFGDTPVDGFAFFATDTGDFNGQIVLDLIFAGGGMQTVEVPHLRTPPPGLNEETFINASLIFFGLTSDDPIESIGFRNSAPEFGDRFGLDNFVVSVSNPIPEPSSLVLLGMGMICLADCGWRRKRRSLPA